MLEIVNLVKYFPIGGGIFERPRIVRAVDGVSLTIFRGETLAVVGESGCGKSTLARCIVRLIEPTSGEIRLHGENLSTLSAKYMREKRRTIQIVFQDPYASLDPRQRIVDSVATPLRLHRLCPPSEIRDRVFALLDQVGLSREFADRHPHELSGGQRQRVCIARALAVEPEILILDEPVSALDMSVQAQVINLLTALQERLGVSYMLISHNLPLVQHISDRIAIMYLGRIVEIGDRATIVGRALHPYTQALFAAAPRVEVSRRPSEERAVLSGELPSPVNPPSGCRFSTRCPFRRDICTEESPDLRPIEGRNVACHFAGEVDFLANRDPRDAVEEQCATR